MHMHIPEKPYIIPADSSSKSNSSDRYRIRINEVAKQARLSMNFKIRIIHKDYELLFVNYFNFSTNV